MTGRLIEERLSLRTRHDPVTGCRVWTACKTNGGYGKMRVGDKFRVAHRVAWELRNGPVPEGLELDHLCGNRACINTDHLEAVTHQENVMRGDTITARNADKTHCHNGHPFNEANTYWLPRGGRMCRACNAVSVAKYRLKGQKP